MQYVCCFDSRADYVGVQIIDARTGRVTSSTHPTPRKGLIFEFVFAYFCPTILTKILILYFGLNYSQYPGEGYGYGSYGAA